MSEAPEKLNTKEYCFITKEYHDSRNEEILLECLALSRENFKSRECHEKFNSYLMMLIGEIKLKKSRKFSSKAVLFCY